MPEIAEVERAAALVRAVGNGKRITLVETLEDNIVYSGVTHEDFAAEITGRVVQNCSRYGKVFYLELEGTGRMPVLHLGMTGMLQVEGQLPTYYRQKPKETPTQWPPRFMKFILHLTDDSTGKVTKLAFMDARRLARIRLCASPLTEPPISALGFDPILSMPEMDEAFSKRVTKRTCTIKALLLDQSFSAGVGNWVADEILYHARIHPEQKCNTLSESQVSAIHSKMVFVCKTAVEANADHSLFPEDWLFKHRWGKGKKAKHTMTLPSGEPATIKFLKVGGRTSAYVVELQHLPTETTNLKTSTSKKKASKRNIEELDEEESDLTHSPESDGDAPEAKLEPPKDTKRRSKRQKTAGP